MFLNHKITDQVINFLIVWALFMEDIRILGIPKAVSTPPHPSSPPKASTQGHHPKPPPKAWPWAMALTLRTYES